MHGARGLQAPLRHRQGGVSQMSATRALTRAAGAVAIRAGCGKLWLRCATPRRSSGTRPTTGTAPTASTTTATDSPIARIATVCSRRCTAARSYRCPTSPGRRIRTRACTDFIDNDEGRRRGLRRSSMQRYLSSCAAPTRTSTSAATTALTTTVTDSPIARILAAASACS